MLKRRRILVAGGAGSIGSELVRQLSEKNEVFVLDQDETGAFDLAEELQLLGRKVHCRVGDVCDREVVHEIFATFMPEIVINAAARKHVRPMQETPMEAVRVNVVGNTVLLEASKRFGIEKYVFVSTDKAVSSNSVMGATKRCSEAVTRSFGKGYVSVRFGNVMGSRGSVIPFWQNQLNRGGKITVTDPRMERYFMSVEQACALIIEAAENVSEGIAVLDMGKKVNILELAKRVVAEAGKDEKSIEIIGSRPGETLTEELMTPEEQSRAVKNGNMYVIA